MALKNVQLPDNYYHPSPAISKRNLYQETTIKFYTAFNFLSLITNRKESHHSPYSFNYCQTSFKNREISDLSYSKLYGNIIPAEQTISETSLLIIFYGCSEVTPQHFQLPNSFTFKNRQILSNLPLWLFYFKFPQLEILTIN